MKKYNTFNNYGKLIWIMLSYKYNINNEETGMNNIDKYEIIQVRLNISFGNDEYEYMLSSADNAAAKKDNSSEHIFAKYISNIDSFKNYKEALTQNLNISEYGDNTLFENTIKRYDDTYFNNKALIILFSDERSGSNKLKLENMYTHDDCIQIEFKRKRGLTMDMAYLLIFLEVDIEDVSQCTCAEATVSPDTDSEASLF